MTTSYQEGLKDGFMDALSSSETTLTGENLIASLQFRLITYTALSLKTISSGENNPYTIAYRDGFLSAIIYLENSKLQVLSYLDRCFSPSI